MSSTPHTLTNQPLPRFLPCRLVDFLGGAAGRPEAADPLARVLEEGLPPSSPRRRVLRSLGSNTDAESFEGMSSGPPSSLKSARPPRPRLGTSLSLAVAELSSGSPHQADGVAQFMATATPSGLRASQQQQQLKESKEQAARSLRQRSSFLQRPPMSAEFLYPL